jgi:hypothetical protein
MDATTYTGNSAASNALVNAGQFKPDLIWFKPRNQAWDHNLQDSVRGTTKYLRSNNTNAEGTVTDGLLSFNSNGFTVGAGGDWNSSSANIVAWQWQAGQGSTSSNTNGSITSTVSVNTTAGFSIVTWTGTGTAGTVGHGLGVAPKMVISKKRNGTSDWAFWITGFAGTELMEMNGTSGKFTGATVWNSTTPTSTVFSVGSATQTNNSGGTYVGYLWAEIVGFSKFGSYTGNGSTDGVFVYTGFLPRFVMLKNYSSGGSWVIHDTARDTYNVTNKTLYPNYANTESTPDAPFDILSNGFKLRSATLNDSGAGFIYAAFAENPFKNANAR